VIIITAINTCVVCSGGFRLGPGGHRPPPKSCPGPPNFWLVPGVYWGYIGVRRYMPYTNLWCFLTAYNYHICHNKTGYTGIYTLTVNKRMCTVHCIVPHQTAEFLSLYVLFNVQRLYSWEALAYNLISIKTSYNTIKDNKKLSCCCDSRSYRVQIRSPHTSAHALESALGSLGTRIGVRTERHCADSRPYKVNALGALRFLWCVLWRNDAS